LPAKNTRIYLDVDGTIIHEDLQKYNQPALYLREFLEALKDFPVYWLTSHCVDGNPNAVRRYLSRLLPQELFQYVLRYEPSRWDQLKTEAIDFSSDFIWFDNDVIEAELDALIEHGVSNNLITIDLVKDPEQLLKIAKRISS
jgi:hypothetical protein